VVIPGDDLLGSADRALVHALVHEAPVALAFYDVTLRYQRVNRRLAEINRLPVEAHLGRRPTEVLDPALGAAVEATLRHVLRTGEVLTDPDFRTTDPRTGQPTYWQSQWFPAYGGTGQITGVAVLVVDVSERRRSEQALQASQQRTERLQQATAELASALTVEEVSRVISAIGRSALGARWSGVALLDGQTRRFRLLGEFPAGGVAGQDIPPDLPVDLPTPTTEALRTGRPVYVGTAAELAAWLPHEHMRTWLQMSGERAWAVVPLLVGGLPVGALRLSFGSERTLVYEERVFLEALAGQCALAVERARLYERERRTATALQRSLLPDRLPTVPGLELAARYLAGSDEAEVGGDWYDVFPLPSGRIALTVGDVMGKGVAAAAGMGRIRSALRALALGEESPAAVLTGLDRLVEATENDEQIVTLVYVVVDPVSGRAVGAQAGHPPLVHVPAGGADPVLLDFGPGSTPLGIPEERHEACATLAPGDLLLGYSDGLIETRARGITQGLDLLVAELARRPGQPVRTLVDDLISVLLAGQRRHDDVTVLALRYRA
jgi:serine phosphatase RsbU (regulator of sigma subunit)